MAELSVWLIHKEVYSAIKSLKNGKFQGLDGIYAEQLRYPAEKRHILLLMALHSMLIHAHLPMHMSTKISPIVKDKKGDLISTDIYMPIASRPTCILSKFFDLII